MIQDYCQRYPKSELETKGKPFKLNKSFHQENKQPLIEASARQKNIYLVFFYYHNWHSLDIPSFYLLSLPFCSAFGSFLLFSPCFLTFATLSPLGNYFFFCLSDNPLSMCYIFYFVLKTVLFTFIFLSSIFFIFIFKVFPSLLA